MFLLSKRYDLSSILELDASAHQRDQMGRILLLGRTLHVRRQDLAPETLPLAPVVDPGRPKLDASHPQGQFAFPSFSVPHHQGMTPCIAPAVEAKPATVEWA